MFHPAPIQRRDPLYYPAGFVPKFNPSHPMAKRTQLSAIFSNGTFINLAPGYASLIGTIAGTVAKKIDGVLGPVKDVGTNYDVTFTGGAVLGSTAPYTLAAIIKTSASDNAGFLSLGTSGPGLARFGGTSTSTFGFSTAATEYDSGIALSDNTPYFVVASSPGGNGFNINFLVLNLVTGKLQTATTAQSNNTGFAGTGFAIGFEGKFSTFWQGQIAAVYGANDYHSLSDLRIWADDPWRFWYSPLPIIAFAGPSTAVIDTPINYVPRAFPPQWNVNRQLFRTMAQDTSSFGVETNPHWRGRTFPPQWNPLPALMRNNDTNAPFVQPETNTHVIPKTWPVQWNPLPFGRTTAQDFSSFGVETNPHWMGKPWPVVWLPRTLLQNSAADVPATAVETNPHWVGKTYAVQWNTLRALWQNTPTDVFVSAIETNVQFIPRTWPVQWNLQASLLRGTPQDFSTLPPASQAVYARYGAAHGIGALSAIPGEIPS